MAKRVGMAGSSATKIAQEKRLHRKTMLLLAMGILLLLVVLSFQINRIFATSAGVIVFVLIIAAMKWLDRFTTAEDKRLWKEEKQARRGAKGEEKISDLLTDLPDGYYVFNDITRIAGDIDHVVVGPTGVFVIETKAHGGKITANGDQLLNNGHPVEKDFINQVWRNAFLIRDLLRNVLEVEAKITPIVVFPNAFVDVRQPVKGVTVTYPKMLLNKIISARPVDLPIKRIVEMLGRKAGA